MMIMSKIRGWDPRRLALITGLSLVAAFAGYQSELMAGATVSHFTFKGDFLDIEWSGFAGTGFSTAWSTAENGVSGPGQPQPVGLGDVFVDVEPFGTFMVGQVFGFSSGLPQGIVTTSVTGNGATGSLNFSIPATLSTWDGTDTGWVDTPVSASTSGSASATGTESLQQRTRRRDKVSGFAEIVRSTAKAGDPTTATGSGGIAITDAMGNPIPGISVPPGTATDWNDIEKVNSGSMTITH